VIHETGGEPVMMMAGLGNVEKKRKTKGGRGKNLAAALGHEKGRGPELSSASCKNCTVEKSLGGPDRQSQKGEEGGGACFGAPINDMLKVLRGGRRGGGRQPSLHRAGGWKEA